MPIRRTYNLYAAAHFLSSITLSSSFSLYHTHNSAHPTPSTRHISHTSPFLLRPDPNTPTSPNALLPKPEYQQNKSVTRGGENVDKWYPSSFTGIARGIIFFLSFIVLPCYFCLLLYLTPQCLYVILPFAIHIVFQFLHRQPLLLYLSYVIFMLLFGVPCGFWRG